MAPFDKSDIRVLVGIPYLTMALTSYQARCLAKIAIFFILICIRCPLGVPVGILLQDLV